MKGIFIWKKWRVLLSYILVAALASVLTMAVSEYAAPNKLAELENLISEKYIEGSDRVALEDAAASAMVAATGDRWSYYIPASEYTAYIEQKANAYVGIGITITQEEAGEGFSVLRVTPESAAHRAGIRAGDVLIGVNGESVLDKDSAGVRELVRGKTGTQVTVTVRRETEEIAFTLTREEIQTTVATGEMLTQTVGLLTILNFNENCSEQAIGAIESLLESGAEKLIVDVRNNPGGYKAELVKLLDYLLPEGPLFQSESYTGAKVVDSSNEKCLEIPMAVLINAESYSAAEFFAAALKEYDWAITVGNNTTGKGHYQQSYRLSDGSAVNLSVGRYYTPNGVNLTQTGGLTPDVLVEVDEETEKLIYGGELKPEQDPQIQAAINTLVE